MKLAPIAALCLGLSVTCAYASEPQTSVPSTVTEAQLQTPQAKNQLEGIAFLAGNKSKPGVVTLPDGLQYKVIEEGKGGKPLRTDTVTVHYEGRLINGTVFDSSFKRGEPATFALAEVIPGWTEALQLMPVGSTWELYIPATLAYGDQNAPAEIGPNQVLIFKVKLLDIKK